MVLWVVGCGRSLRVRFCRLAGAGGDFVQVGETKVLHLIGRHQVSVGSVLALWFYGEQHVSLLFDCQDPSACQTSRLLPSSQSSLSLRAVWRYKLGYRRETRLGSRERDKEVEEDGYHKPLHPTLQIRLRISPALIRIIATVSLETAEVRRHECLAFACPSKGVSVMSISIVFRTEWGD